MKTRSPMLWGLALLAIPAVAFASNGGSLMAADSGNTLVATVRGATEPYRTIEAAEEAGYGLFHGCASGPQEGAMGVHYVNGDLVGDGLLDAEKPEALLYEFRNGRSQLVGVEFVVIAEAWHAHDEMPPVMRGDTPAISIRFMNPACRPTRSPKSGWSPKAVAAPNSNSKSKVSSMVATFT